MRWLGIRPRAGAARRPATADLCAGPSLGATMMVGSLTASPPRRRAAAGRLKEGPRDFSTDRPHGTRPAPPPSCRSRGWALQEPHTHWPRPRRPEPITEGGGSVPNGSAAGVRVRTGLCARPSPRHEGSCGGDPGVRASPARCEPGRRLKSGRDPYSRGSRRPRCPAPLIRTGRWTHCCR